jgi:hypothetical protein
MRLPRTAAAGERMHVFRWMTGRDVDPQQFFVRGSLGVVTKQPVISKGSLSTQKDPSGEDRLSTGVNKFV